MIEPFPIQIKKFDFGTTTLLLPIPDEQAVSEHFLKLPEGERYKGFWTRLWPSATAICRFLIDHPDYIRSKTVWEIGAGLGLPALFAATMATKVMGSDYSEDAVRNMNYASKINGLINFDAFVWDWTGEIPAPECDTILLSDANYDEALHPPLQKLLLQQLEAGKTVVLSTPVRLSGQGFLDPLMRYCQKRSEYPSDPGIYLFLFCKVQG